MIQINDICLAFGGQDIFKDISVNFSDDQRVGLVGRNGSGKSTLLKAIAEDGVLDSGKVAVSNSKKIGYMPQEVVLASDKSIIDEAMSAFGDIYKAHQEIKKMESALNGADNQTLERYCDLQAKLADHNIEQHKVDAEKMLAGLGFKKEQLNGQVSSLSVGWKMRVVLAKLLLQDADFYLFDEPTNHLDIVAKEWFLQFLKDSKFGFLLVCHERYFLDELCDYIFELELGNGKMYTGNYSKFLVQKEKNLKLLQNAYDNQQKEIKRKQAVIDRFRYKTSKARMAQSMLKELEKVELIELPPSAKDINFTFPQIAKAPRVVLSVKNLEHKFGDKQIFKNVSFKVERGQKIAVIAANGVGKTTLFNLVAGILPVENGTVENGSNVKTAIFAQDQNKALSLDRTVLQNVQNVATKSAEQTIRKFLGSFLFDKEAVEKYVSVLSGGEKNRVGMVNVLLQGANLLLLDEPTNHLDISSKEILLKALQEYQGTMLFVSHDKDFVNDLATHIIELTTNGAYFYHGNYDSYIAQKNDFECKTKSSKGVKVDSRARPELVEGYEQKKALQKEINHVERKISQIESKIEKLNSAFANLEYGTDKFFENQKKLEFSKKELVTAEEQWEALIHRKGL